MKLIFGTHQHDGRDDGLRRHRGYLHAVLQDSPGGHPGAVQELVLLHSVLHNLRQSVNMLWKYGNTGAKLLGNIFLTYFIYS